MSRRTFFGEREQEYIDRMLPCAISCNRFICRPDKREEYINLITARKRVLKKGLLENKQITNRNVDKYTNTSRDFLTTFGYEQAVETIIPADIRAMIPKDADSLVRSKTPLAMERVVRLADVQCFLTSLGILDPYHSVVKGIDPFVFGYPSLQEFAGYPCMRSNTKDEDAKPTIYEFLMGATVCAAKQCVKPTESGLPERIFIPNRVIPLLKDIKDVGQSKKFNNISGILLNLPYNNAYVVFKPLQRDKFFWRAKTYRSEMSICGNDLQKLGVTNYSNVRRTVNAAIFLCETPAELKRKTTAASDMNDVSEPFDHVFGVLMNSSGIEQISSMLGQDINDYITNNALPVIAKLDDLSAGTNVWGETFYRRRSDNKTVEIGTVVDFVVLNRVKRNQGVYGMESALACYESQMDFYLSIGINRENIVTIPDDD